MKVIYHCYGGAHSSVTAANIHLGLMPGKRTPGYNELINQKLFDHNQFKDSGRIIFMGHDGRGNEVYIVGRRSRPSLLYDTTECLSYAFGINSRSYLLVDVASHVNIIMKAGGILSRRLGLVSIGRPLVTWGTLISYRGILKLVEKTLKIIPAGSCTGGIGLVSNANSNN
ncbi:MAG TPA: hypothetical protein DEF36_07835 [Desulfotomaculum sp.]|nr:hypothetical protein [Desulfotomaculum sp.]